MEQSLMQLPGDTVIMQDPSAKNSIPCFTGAEALAAFGPGMINSDVVGEWVLHRIHPNGDFCVYCGSVIHNARAVASFRSGGRVRCRSCGRWFTRNTNTVFHGSALDPIRIYLLAVLSEFSRQSGCRPVAARACIARILQIHTDTVINWQDKLEAIAQKS